MQNLIIFEDSKYWQFSPLTYLRPVYDLRCGINLLKDKIIRQYPETMVNLFCRKTLADLVKSESEYKVNDYNLENGLLVNGRAIGHFLSEFISLNGEDKIYKNDEEVVAIRFSSNKQLENLILEDGLIDASNSDIPVEYLEISFLISFPWDLVYENGKEIIRDFNWYFHKSKPQILGSIYEGSYLLNEGNIHIGYNTIVKPGVVIDAEEGPVLIGNDVKIMPNSVISGPVFIGDGSTIKTGAKILDNTSIGEGCKVGGEVDSTIFQSYSNKQHDGFLGHSYVASWVNLGADTNNSDLKNNYSNITFEIHKTKFNTNRKLFGLVMGDHSKSAINTQFNTGTYIGCFSNVFGEGFPPKVIPSFSWGGFNNEQIYNSDKAIGTAKMVKQRRGQDLSASEIEIIKRLVSIREKEI